MEALLKGRWQLNRRESEGQGGDLRLAAKRRLVGKYGWRVTADSFAIAVTGMAESLDRRKRNGRCMSVRPCGQVHWGTKVVLRQVMPKAMVAASSARASWSLALRGSARPGRADPIFASWAQSDRTRSFHPTPERHAVRHRRNRLR
jgi:hypothetical protein